MGSAARAWAGFVVLLGACGTDDADAPFERPLRGSWTMVASCLYDTSESDPCRPVARGRRVAFDIDENRVSSSDDSWDGDYRLEVRPLQDRDPEILLHLPRPGAPAQIWFHGDTLVVSWTYVDGGEERYVQSAASPAPR